MEESDTESPVRFEKWTEYKAFPNGMLAFRCKSTWASINVGDLCYLQVKPFETPQDKSRFFLTAAVHHRSKRCSIYEIFNENTSALYGILRDVSKIIMERDRDDTRSYASKHTFVRGGHIRGQTIVPTELGGAELTFFVCTREEVMIEFSGCTVDALAQLTSSSWSNKQPRESLFGECSVCGGKLSTCGGDAWEEDTESKRPAAAERVVMRLCNKCKLETCMEYHAKRSFEEDLKLQLDAKDISERARKRTAE